MAQKHVVVAGASGLVGYGAVKHLAGVEGAKVTALSRRAPLDTKGATFRPLDLLDAQASADFARTVPDATHLVFAALHEEPSLIAGWLQPKQMAANDAMFRNLLDPLVGAAPGLRHVTLLQGTKA